MMKYAWKIAVLKKILTYGSQTWSYTKTQKNNLGVCQRAMAFIV